MGKAKKHLRNDKEILKKEAVGKTKAKPGKHDKALREHLRITKDNLRESQEI